MNWQNLFTNRWFIKLEWRLEWPNSGWRLTYWRANLIDQDWLNDPTFAGLMERWEGILTLFIEAETGKEMKVIPSE